MNAFHVLGAAMLLGTLSGCAEPVLEEPPIGHVYDCSVERAWQAVERVVHDLNYTTRENRRDDEGAILRARSDEAGELFVRASVFWEGTTLVSVAAPNGNRDAEEEILARIDADLRSASGRSFPTGAR
jgi:hypothetical protein